MTESSSLANQNPLLQQKVQRRSIRSVIAAQLYLLQAVLLRLIGSWIISVFGPQRWRRRHTLFARHKTRDNGETDPRFLFYFLDSKSSRSVQEWNQPPHYWHRSARPRLFHLKGSVKDQGTRWRQEWDLFIHQCFSSFFIILCLYVLCFSALSPFFVVVVLRPCEGC